MATTYTLISSVTVSSASVANIEFTSIPQTYTDLLVKLSTRQTKSDGYSEIYMKINNSSSDFTIKVINCVGTSVTSYSHTVGIVGSALGVTSSGGTSSFSNNEIYIPNYTSSNYKSYFADGAVDRNHTTWNPKDLIAGLWSNTSAITSLLFESPGYNIEQYSTAYLYGISNA
jgi:hypothetical protein